MELKKNSLLMAAAVAGLLTGTAGRTSAAPTGGTQATSTVQAKASAGKISVAKVSFAAEDKHSCKGKNDCKGKGGCKTGDNGCKGKNTCKGKGGCATDGTKPPSLA
ncbi:MAG: hypothetical protein JOZ48_18080 [Acidobacteriaceae bacterium]|nr:hypothetical protein [Acidobacteriaceae bacterium]